MSRNKVVTSQAISSVTCQRQPGGRGGGGKRKEARERRSEGAEGRGGTGGGDGSREGRGKGRRQGQGSRAVHPDDSEFHGGPVGNSRSQSNTTNLQVVGIARGAYPAEGAETQGENVSHDVFHVGRVPGRRKPKMGARLGLPRASKSQEVIDGRLTGMMARPPHCQRQQRARRRPHGMLPAGNCCHSPRMPFHGQSGC